MDFDVVAINLEAPLLYQTAYSNTYQALETLENGGHLDKVKLNGQVMVKPNFTQPPNPSLKYGPRSTDLTVHNHVCTDPFSIKAACQFVLDHGGRPCIGEGTKWPGGTRGVYLQQGCEVALEGMDVRMVDTATSSQEERVTVFPSRVWNPDYASFEVSKAFDGIDTIINMAKLKSHSNALVSGAVKNMYGVLEPPKRRAEGHYCADPLWAKISRRRMAEGYRKLSETFVQVHDGLIRHFRMDEICVIEGIISGEGDGPLFRPARPRQENMVMASVNNPATIDAAESYFMGFSPEYLYNYARARLIEMGYPEPGEDFLRSYGEQYFLKLAESIGMGKVSDINVYAISMNASEIIPADKLGLLRNGPPFELPTFVQYLTNTYMSDMIPDGEYEFKVEAAA